MCLKTDKIKKPTSSKIGSTAVPAANSRGWELRNQGKPLLGSIT
jgi:hypothetical protein